MKQTQEPNTDNHGDTALHRAASNRHAGILSLLLQAGADPTTRNNFGRTPLHYPRSRGHQPCIALLEPAMAEPQRARSLLKARALLDATYAIPKARTESADKGEPPATQQEKALAAAPAYLKGRVEHGQKLPAVVVDSEKEKLLACLKYALGLEGGEDGQGMPREVFIELCEVLVPKWDRANV
jgi:hypothetical protein